jgi:uncharacterized membrane protein
MPNLPLAEWFVLAWFCSCWVGYTYFARRKSKRKASLVMAMRIYRREWFKHMLGHQTRIAHIAALGSLQSVTTFFASTALVILGGLVALLGTTDRVIDLAADLPFARHDSEIVWLVRIILLIFIFVYAFFVFTWSIRQYNFCAVLVGAAPHTERPGEHEGFLDTITDVASYAAENFNLGLRAYYFALAAMTWFLHPWLFAATSALVTYVLHEREFRSQTLRTLTRRNSILQSLHLPEEVARKPRPRSDED